MFNTMLVYTWIIIDKIHLITFENMKNMKGD